MPLRPSSKSKAFISQGTLAHRGSLHTVAVTPGGNLIATGGSKGTFVWDYKTKAGLTTPGHTPTWGSTTVAVWRSHPDLLDELLAFGTQNGHLVFWRQTARGTWEETFSQQVTGQQEVTGLAFDPPSSRLLVANRAGVVILLRVDKPVPKSIFAVELLSVIPIAVAFGNMNGDIRNALVFDKMGRRMITLHGNSGQLESQKSVGRIIGAADVNVQQGVFCIDDSAFGAVLLRLDTGAVQTTFQVKNLDDGIAHPKQVALTDCGAIVSGSDHGSIYVFDRKSSELIDEIVIEPKRSYQTITTTKIGGSTVIFTGKSRGDVDGDNPVYILKRRGAILNSHIGLAAVAGWAKTVLQVLIGMGLFVLLVKSGVVNL